MPLFQGPLHGPTVPPIVHHLPKNRIHRLWPLQVLHIHLGDPIPGICRYVPPGAAHSQRTVSTNSSSSHRVPIVTTGPLAHSCCLEVKLGREGPPFQPQHVAREHMTLSISSLHLIIHTPALSAPYLTKSA